MANRTDKESSKFVPSESRTDEWAIEVVVGNGSSNPIPVESTESGSTVNQYNEETAVPASSTTTITSYTVPAGQELKLKHVELSGTNIADYEVEIDGAVVAKVRTWWSGFNAKLDFFDLTVAATKVVLVRVNNYRTSTGDFNARIVGRVA